MPTPLDGRHNHQKVVGRGRDRRRRGQPDHNETSATPQTTSDAPVQRSQLTRSFKKYLASTVSSTYETAETGTAKLRSAEASSFMKAKKDAAMHTIDPMTKRLRAISARARPTAPGRKSWISPWRRMPIACSTSPAVVDPTMIAISSHIIAILPRHRKRNARFEECRPTPAPRQP